jgi:hypothetical protein
MEIARTEDEIEDVIGICADSENEGSMYSGMSYEQGIRAAIEWMTEPDHEGLF